MTLTHPAPAPATAGPASLPITEISGPVLCPLGPSAGRNASLVRLGGRPAAAIYPMLVEEILAGLPYAPLALVAGEPMLYQNRRSFVDLVEHLAVSRWRVELDTDGTVPPTGANAVRLFEHGNVVWNVRLDPLLHEADSDEDARLRRDALVAYADLANAARAAWILTVRGAADVRKALALADMHRVDRRRVWLTPPETAAGAAVLVGREIMGVAAAEGVNVALSHQTLLGL